MKVIEPKVIHHIYQGVIVGNDVQKLTKKYHELAYLYAKKREDDPIVYEVYSYSQGDNVLGNLNWGLTVLKPIDSFGECNMTKGHFHENMDCAEFYFGIAGEGLLLMMDENGYTWAEKIFEGSLHYIDGHVAHRLINIGDTDLKVGACWSTSAGHDYKRIEKHEFGYRVFKKDGKIVYVER